MQKRLGQTEDEANASSSQLHPDDELYAVPADLQVCSVRLLTICSMKLLQHWVTLKQLGIWLNACLLHVLHTSSEHLQQYCAQLSVSAIYTFLMFTIPYGSTLTCIRAM